MSPRQFSNLLEGWKEAEGFKQRQEWERSRYVARSVVSALVPVKDKGKLDKAFSLPWDGENKKEKKKLAYDDSPEALALIEKEAIRNAKKIK